MNSVMIVAAEASSAQYALDLMKFWKSQNLTVNVFGVGSQQMQDYGMERFGKSEEMAVVGIAEVVRHYSHLKSVFETLVAEALRRRPDFVLLMDYPDFNLRLAEKLKKTLGAQGIKVFYYISPQVWAWRKGRIHQIKKYCDKVFLLFPFEKDFYDAYGVANEFVGHPLLDHLDSKLFDQSEIQMQRQRYGVTSQEKILALMPGSRRSEIEHHFFTQLKTAQILLQKFSQLRVFVLVAPTLKKQELQAYCDQIPFSVTFVQSDPNAMIALADYVLVASGTATLMVGLLEKPMVIMYKMKWLTGLIAKLLVRGVKFFGLVNLISNKEIVPERMQEQANPENLALLLERMITDVDYTKQIIFDLKNVKNKLGDKGATERVGRSLMNEFRKLS